MSDDFMKTFMNNIRTSSKTGIDVEQDNNRIAYNNYGIGSEEETGYEKFENPLTGVSNWFSSGRIETNNDKVIFGQNKNTGTSPDQVNIEFSDEQIRALGNW